MSDAKSLRAVVIDDSAICRDVLRHILQADGDITVVGDACDGTDGVAAVRKLRPDVVTMDIDMPRADGLAAIREIMRECPVPILVVTGRPSAESTILFQALELGALDLVGKPALMDEATGPPFRDFVRQLARTPVFLRSGNEPTQPSASDPGPRISERAPVSRRHARIVGLVGSTGGPLATLTILRDLGGQFPLPIVIAQQLPPGTEDAYARFLESGASGASALSVEVLRGEAQAAAGKILLVPPGMHVTCDSAGKIFTYGAPGTSSGDSLLHALADTYGESAVGVILSGATDDGVSGLRAIRSHGGLALAEADESATAPAGPRKAFEAGAAERILSAPLIASALLALGYPQESLDTLPPKGGPPRAGASIN